jgi:hypothetical protein
VVSFWKRGKSMVHRKSLLALFVLLAMVGTGVGSDAQGPANEIWSEGGLRVSTEALQLDLSGDARARVRLVSIKGEFTVEASTLIVTSGNPSGMVVKSTGPATVAASDGRRMHADAVEVWLSHDGWAYFKATRRIVRR